MSVTQQPAPQSNQPVTTQSADSNPFGKIEPKDLVVTQADWDYLASAIHHLRVDTTGLSFLGSMLQSIMIEFSARIPTACISYKPNKKQFLIELNPAFFRLLQLEERMGILLHEIDHMTHCHLTRIPALEDRMKANKAADAAINQIINKDLGAKQGTAQIPTRMPIRGIFPEDFGLAKDLTLEDYYDQWPDPPQQNGNQGQQQQQGSGKGQKGGQGGQGGGQPNGTGPNGQPQGNLVDVHDWDPNVDESDVLDGVEEVVKRTMIKTNKSYSQLPGNIQQLLETIEKRRKQIDWKRQMKMFIKRHATGIDKEYTRTRPNKRYDYASPGLKLGELPKVLFLEDTSGSMSVIEVNAGLDQADEIMKVGMRNVMLGLWHTALYKVMKYKKGLRSEVHKKVQSGGTDFEPCAAYIQKMKPDAVIVFTDGYFGDTTTKVECPILFVISNGGAAQLPTTYPKQRMVKLPPMGEE